MAMMKAIVLEGVKDLQLREIPQPEADGKNVLLKVEAAGICGSDIHHYWTNGVPVGMVLGHEFTGTIVDPGESGLAVGDLVVVNEFDPCMKDDCPYCGSGRAQICPEIWKESPGLAAGWQGGFAQYCLVKPHRVYKLAPEVTAEQGCLAEPLAITYHACKDRGHIGEGTEAVLVSGGGGIGVFSAMNAKALGAKFVAISEVDDLRMESARSMPFVDAVFDARDPKFHDNLMAATNGNGFDAIIECSGMQKALEGTILAVRLGGYYVNVGANQGFHMPGVQFSTLEASFTGSNLFRNEEFEEVVEKLNAGEYAGIYQYTETAPLAEAQNCILKATSGKCAVAKFILTPNK